MGLETGTYISDLVSTNPVAGDPKSEGDDHIRLLKATIKATFPNINGAMTATDEELSGLATANLADAGGSITPGTNWNTTVVRLRKVTKDYAQLEGTVVGTGAATSTLMILPAGYRPSTTLYGVAVFFDFSANQLYSVAISIANTGAVSIAGAGASLTFASTDTVHFNMLYKI